MKVLLVDDNAQMRKMMREYLPPMTDTYECSDGDTAVNDFFTFNPDWVLMDLKMQRMDGITATEIIHTKDPCAKVIIVTNYDDEQTRNAAKRVGAFIISKENLHAIRDLIQDSQIHAEALR